MTTGGPRVRRGVVPRGRFAPPGDKSITHRGALFGLLAEGTTRVGHANPGEDCARSFAAAAALGASVEHRDGVYLVTGCPRALRAPAAAIDCGNSGTTMRLLAGVLAARPFEAELFGDASLSRRPMARVLEPLRAMGAHVDSAAEGRPPLRLRGGALRGRAFDLPVASAQVATCILLAGLRASGATEVQLPGPARDHTERLLPAFGVPLEITPQPSGGRRVRLAEGTSLRATSLVVPGDFSAAAFFLAAAAAEPGAEVTATGVSVNPTRTGLLDALAAMGAEVALANAREEAGEPVADVTVRGPERLTAIDLPAEWIPRMVDEIPAWAVAACAAAGTSRVRGARELRVKESDRIVALARNFASCGIATREHPDGLEIDGGEARGARIEAHGDHRIVMAFAALGSRTREPMSFDDVASVPTSFPGFFGVLSALGAGVEGEAA